MGRPKKHVEIESSNDDRDELLLSLQQAANARQKDGYKVAHFLDEEDDPSQVPDWISTGSTLLDLAISNRQNGGLPVGRIVEITGLEGTGKSLMCAHLIASTQAKNGVAVMIDSENSAAPLYWQSLGVNLKKMLYMHFSNLEDIFSGLEFFIADTRKQNSDRIVTIIVDSIAGAPTKKEQEAGYDAEGYNTAKSIILSKAMKKLTGLIGDQKILLVLNNQLRMNLKAVPFGDQYVVPGGKAIPYHSSVRIRLTNVGKVKNADKEEIGATIQAQVKKNRLGPPFRTAKFDVHYDSGIQDLSSWLAFMKDKGLITGTKAKYVFKGKNGNIEFNAEKFVEMINTDKEFKDEIYEAICNKYIMHYRDPNSMIDENVIYTDETDGDASEESNKEE